MPELTHPTVSLRRYAGDYDAHAHGHAQVLFGFDGRLEMEIAGRAAFVDASCGLIIPAGVAHAFVAPAETRVVVVDAPMQPPLQRLRQFAITRRSSRVLAALDDAQRVLDQALAAPRILARRGLDLARLDAALASALHEPWSTARMAALFFLSPQRFHARLLELQALTPQQYLRRLRLARAREHLRAGRTLEATALLVGYRSASALAFALKREYGVASRRLRLPGRVASGR